MDDAKRTVTRLDQHQTYALCKLLERDREIVTRLTLKELADRYSAELGFKITDNNMETVCEVTGIQAKLLRPRKPKAATSADLEKVVRALCVKLGEDYDRILCGDSEALTLEA